MLPSHIIKARANESTAITERKQAEENLSKAEASVKTAKDGEGKAAENAKNGILKTRRIATGKDWWGNTTYRTETYHDKSAEGLKTAQEALNAATAKREEAEKDQQDATAKLDTAKVNETKAINARVFAERLWKVSMTILGLILGIGGLIFFFTVNKKFGLKLLILNFSVFGFTLSLVASGFSIWLLLITLSEIIVLVCIFLYCFRPNVIISIKNKTGKMVIDIRRDILFNRHSNNRTGFNEVIPTDECEDAIRKIGAIIGNIQKMDNLGQQSGISKQPANEIARQE